MRKIFLIFAILCLAFTSNAQTSAKKWIRIGGKNEFTDSTKFDAGTAFGQSEFKEGIKITGGITVDSTHGSALRILSTGVVTKGATNPGTNWADTTILETKAHANVTYAKNADSVNIYPLVVNVKDSLGAVAGVKDYVTHTQQTAALAIYSNNFLLGIRALGSTALAVPIGMGPLGTGSTMTSGRVEYIAVYLAKASTITGIKWMQHTKGVYWAGAFNGVALYKITSSSSWDKVAESQNDTMCWKKGVMTSGDMMMCDTFKTGASYPLGTPQTYAATAGPYMIALLYMSVPTSTTAPVIQACTWTSNVYVKFDFPGINRLNQYKNTQTSFTTPVTTITDSNGGIMFVELF